MEVDGLNEAVVELTSRPGVVMLLGSTDSGKTTLATALVNAGLKAGLRVAVIDGDVGQSDVGPPATVGMGIARVPIGSLGDIPAHVCRFVGTNSPEPVVAETVTAVRLLLDRAIADGAQMVIIDTTGLVSGWQGRSLKAAKIDLCRPDYIVALQRKRELDHLLSRRLPAETRVIRLTISGTGSKKSHAQRRSTRQERFARAFAGGQELAVEQGRVRIERGFLGSGRELSPGELRSVAEQDCDIARAERIPEGLLVVTRGSCPRLSLERVRRRAGVARIVVTNVEDYRNLLVGLVDDSGNLLNIGVLEEIDFLTGLLRIYTRTPGSDIAGVQLGLLHITRTGEEIGRIAPGSV